MSPGSKAEFWRTVAVAPQLARLGWSPWSLSFNRSFPLDTNSQGCKVFQQVYLSNWGCHAGAWASRLEKNRPSLRELSEILHGRMGAGTIRKNPGNGIVTLMRGIASVGEFEGPMPGVRRVARRKLSASRRARLIEAALPWFRSRTRAGWSPQSIIFRMSRRFTAAGICWKLVSDIVFARNEGVYWNSLISTKDISDHRSFNRVKASGFFDDAVLDLRRAGFRHPSSVAMARARGLWLNWFFDQDYLPPGELLRKAAFLASWHPPRVPSLTSP
jgi:hypothetical protein